MFDWIQLLKYVPGEGSKNPSYQFDLGKGKGYFISEVEVKEAAQLGNVQGI